MEGESTTRIENDSEAVTKILTNDISTSMSTNVQPPQSKRFLKRLAKSAKWEETKKLKRQNQRVKKKIRNAKVAGTVLSRKSLKLKKMEISDCKIGVVIDLSFDSEMLDKDIHKTVKQVHRCYSINRRLPNPVQFHVTSFNGETAKIMGKHDGFINWDVRFHKEPFEEVFDKSSIVYLTSESENVIEKLEPDKFYIIGGLVDHNSKKGICYQAALDKNVSHGRLPIDKFCDMKTRKVLSIVHVFEVLAKVSEGSSWQDSLLTVIPQRKMAEPKELQT